MNLWFRLIWLALTLPFRARVDLNIGVRHHHRVWPSDCDVNLHLTNSRYASFADLARVALIARSGLAKLCWTRGWRPMVVASKIRFRREVKPLRAFQVEMKLVWWNETSAIFETRFFSRNGAGENVLHAVMLERNVLYHRNERRYIQAGEAMAALGVEPRDLPEPTPEIVAFAKAEEEMRKLK
jgi:acyl-CoA thioesterase FadM